MAARGRTGGRQNGRMPELPEVETVRRQLEPAVVGRTIESAEVLDERWTRPEPPGPVARALAGRRIDAVDRRGKYLVVRFDNGSSLVMHLRMTGNLLLRPAGSGAVADLMATERFGGPRLYESHPEARHLRARMVLDDGSELWFTDARRFGHGVVLAGDGIDDYFASRLGVEPLDGELTPELLLEVAAGRRAPLKSFLLNQTRIAGIANGGSSIDDYRDARGERGSMQNEFLVHTHEAEPCLRCGETIRRVVVAGRSTYFCPGCQRRLRARPRRRRRARR